MLQRDSAEIANAAARAGITDLAMDFMGRALDSTTTRYGSGASVSNAAVASTYAVRKTEAAKRYDTWKTWTLPTEGRQTVRMVTHWNSGANVPAEFRKSKQVEGTMSNEKIVSNFNELIDAAKESGRLEQLLAEAKDAFDKELPNENFLYTILLIKQNDIKTAKPLVEKLFKIFKERMKPKSGIPTPNLWGDYLLCRACLNQSSEFASLCREGTNTILEAARSRSDSTMITNLKFDLAQRRAEDLGSKILPGSDAQLDFWFPINLESPSKSWWVKDEDSLTHIAGPVGRELLCFRYPVVGDFRFSFDAFDANWSKPTRAMAVSLSNLITEEAGETSTLIQSEAMTLLRVRRGEVGMKTISVASQSNPKTANSNTGKMVRWFFRKS